MGDSFRTSFRPVPAVGIRVARNGLSTTVGPAGRAGSRSYGGTPLQGAAAAISLRSVGDPRHSGPLATDPHLIPGTRVDYGGGDVGRMTSPGLGPFKALLADTKRRRDEIRADALKARVQLGLAWAGHAFGWLSLAAAVPPVRKALAGALTARRSELATLKANLEATRIRVDFDLASEIAGPYRRMQASFDEMTRSARKWGVATKQDINRVKARTFAGTVVSRVAATLCRAADPLVDTSEAPLAFGMLGGRSTAYVYPGFILVAGRSGEFALLDLREVEVACAETNFTETDSPPADAEMVDKTWAKANKNGSRDRRFAHNRELPIMRYGQLQLSAESGLNEVFMVSRAAACRQFAVATAELRGLLAHSHPKQSVGQQRRLGRP